MDQWEIRYSVFHPKAAEDDKAGVSGIKISDKKRPPTNWEKLGPKQADREYGVYRDWAKSWGWPDWYIESEWIKERDRRRKLEAEMRAKAKKR